MRASNAEIRAAASHVSYEKTLINLEQLEVVYQQWGSGIPKKTFNTTHSDHLVMLLSFYQRVWKLGMFSCIFAVNCCCLCALLDPGGAALYF